MLVLKSIGYFIQNQVLGMKWLNALIGNLLTSFGLDIDQKLGGSLQFFIYDVIKIFILLSVLIFIISYIQSHFPPERTKKILGRFKGISANVMGALLGTITPFCSCSSIPLFIGFTNAGLPLGVTLSFLVSSPLVDLGAFILLISIFGGKIAIAYVVVGLILAITSGTMMDKMGMEKHVERYVYTGSNVDIEAPDLSRKDRIEYARSQVAFIVHKVWKYILIGVGIGALIHNWIPQPIIEKILGEGNPFSVIIATVIGIPMYADIFGTIPVAEALYGKGVGVGTILSFMMAVTALSLPSMIMLSRVMKKRLLTTFIIVIAIGIVIIGYTFNALGYLFA